MYRTNTRSSSVAGLSSNSQDASLAASGPVIGTVNGLPVFRCTRPILMESQSTSAILRPITSHALSPHVSDSRVIAASLDGTDREAIVKRMVGMAERLRDDEVIMSVLSSAPALAMVYISQRMGTSQQILLEVLAGALAAAQTDGSVRPGDPKQLAAMCLLIVQSAIQSAQMVAPVLDVAALDIELAHSLNGYLKP